MSRSFEIFPTIEAIPKSRELLNLSVELFNNFFRDQGIEKNIDVKITENSQNKDFYEMSENIITRENDFQVYNIDDVGEVYLFYFPNTELDRRFWTDEIRTNRNAHNLRKEIEANLAIGHSWCVKRTMNQPPIVSLYYGYLAIALAVLTKGIIFSSDGAWDYQYLPILGENFINVYSDLTNLGDVLLQGNIEKWLNTLKKQ